MYQPLHWYKFYFRYMGIGLSAQGVSMNRLPGWDKNSYGYHGDDGHSFCSSGTGQPYGPTFSTGAPSSLSSLYWGCVYFSLPDSVLYHATLHKIEAPAAHELVGVFQKEQFINLKKNLFWRV